MARWYRIYSEALDYRAEPEAGIYSQPPRGYLVRTETPDVNRFVVQLANHNAEFLLCHPAAPTWCCTLNVLMTYGLLCKLWKPDNLYYA